MSARDILVREINAQAGRRAVGYAHVGRALAALVGEGFAVVQLPEPEVGLRGRHEVPGTGIEVQFTTTEFIMWIPNNVNGTTLRKTFDREAGDVLIGALLAAREKKET